MKIEKFNLSSENQNVTLTTYLLDDSPETINGKPRPGIIICPGGGYFSCSDREAEPVAIKFASLGYHAFVLRYSTYSDGSLELPDLSKPLPVKKDRIFPRQVIELGKAMVLVKKHASEWNLDPEKVAVCGFSAGGHNAALYSTSWNQTWVKDQFGNDASLLKPALSILGYALTDYVMLSSQIDELPAGMDKSFMIASFVAYLGMEKPDQELLEQVSPARHVDSNTPPSFIWANFEDPLVSIQHSIKLAEAMKSENIPFELHIFEKGTHGLSLADQTSAAAKSQIIRHTANWFDLCAEWLEDRFALPLPELSDFEKMQQEQNS
ncbi:alpha/beta hydrolase [Xylocopilactobacillus apis]|uniref:Endo-1,4-beta-xylanase n=1 Tax=Xylocopilactobacillus apis TaxID=2932183 RepID=A0AAU9D5F5_9LACO|nr:alpha/beta hydrolase [Xylocopilactobacillus apis]BDR56635.1 endo-1,4-beta-xylanase [Xylocopilactobacillus apis]